MRTVEDLREYHDSLKIKKDDLIKVLQLLKMRQHNNQVKELIEKLDRIVRSIRL